MIKARDLISKWGHTAIDDLVLEAGVDGLEAGREIGSRRDRANAVVRFALESPSVLTAEGFLFSAFLTRAAYSSEDSISADDALTVSWAEELPDVGLVHEPADRATDKVFIVHGQNDGAQAEVSEFLEQLGLQGIVLHDQPNMGRHLLTKFIEEAELVTFAVVLMTDDDVGGLTPEALAPRARQNVILELGYFLSHLGQQRICALITPGLETPSDFDGIVYIRMDDTQRWQQELQRELEALGMPVKPRANR